MRVSASSERANFSAGELAPRLRTRRDLAKHQAGVARLENMVAVLEGVVTRRPGTQFVLPLANEAQKGKQIPFRFSNSDSYDIVINGGFARWFKDGGYVQNPDGSPYQIAVPYAEADLPLLRWAASGNAVFIACAGRRPQVLTRIANDSWTIAEYLSSPTPLDPQNLDTTKTVQTSFVTTPGGTITASAAGIITADDVGTVWRLDETDLDLVPQWTANETGLLLNDERRWQGNVYRVVTLAGATAGPNAPTHEKGKIQAGKGHVVWQFRHKSYGYIRITSQVSATVFNANYAGPKNSVALPESNKAVGTYRYWPSAWSDGKGWPDNVRIHQNRLVWFRRDQFWLTESDDFYSFEITPNNLQVPTDASAIPGRFLSPDGSLVENQWSLASGVLVIGVRDGEWLLRAPNSADAVTLTNVRLAPDGTEGSASHVPALADGGVAFIGRSRRRLHYIDFDRLEERLQIDEITISARHILKGRAAGLAYQRDPERVLWVWCEDGSLVGFTFYPKINPPFVAAHRHPLVNGAVEDMVCIAGENGETIDVYLIIRRTIDGATRRYVERLTPFFEAVDDAAPDASGAWFVDCGLRLISAAPIVNLGGLGHLEGETVAIFADGADRGTAVVDGGVIDLERPAYDITVGLPINWRVKLLPVELDTQKGPSKNTMKTAHQVAIDVVESAGGACRVNGGELEDLTYTGTLDYGAAVPLTTGPLIATVSAEPQLEATVEIVGSSTLPFTLAAVTPALGVGGA